MRKWSVLLVLAALSGLGSWSARAQESVGGVIHSRYRTFRIPFKMPTLGPGVSPIRQVQLYVSIDQGQTWQASANAPPDQGHFRFTAERDGLHWFAVQTVDLDNRVHPPNMQGAQANLKVVVDTTLPQVQLQGLPPQGDRVGVSWDIRDDNLEFLPNDTVRLEYRPAGGQAWVPLNLPLGSSQLYWRPETPGPVEVRLQARDRAGNSAQTAVIANPAGNQGFTPAPAGGFSGAPAASGIAPQGAGTDATSVPADPDRRLVNSKRISLNYELKEVGPSGVSSVELWYTLNGRSWNKYPQRFEEPKQTAISFDVEGEGVYGISLCAKSGVGLGERPPQFGDRPQLWIEVDLTKPVVQLQSVLVGNGPDKGKLSISWSARDKNLARDPITLSYAEQATGPWRPFADKIGNSGRHIWTMPDGVPYQFYVRVEAIDAAGNVGEALTPEPVKVDLSTPRVKILNVEPGR